mgnify:CR=1 FL=1
METSAHRGSLTRQLEQVSARVGRLGLVPHPDGEHEGEPASAEDSPEKKEEEA